MDGRHAHIRVQQRCCAPNLFLTGRSFSSPPTHHVYSTQRASGTRDKGPHRRNASWHTPSQEGHRDDHGSSPWTYGTGQASQRDRSALLSASQTISTLRALIAPIKRVPPEIIGNIICYCTLDPGRPCFEQRRKSVRAGGASFSAHCAHGARYGSAALHLVALSQQLSDYAPCTCCSPEQDPARST